MKTYLCHPNGRMECWNAGILGIRAEINHFNCKKFLSFNFVQDKLTHHSITPLFLPSETFFLFHRGHYSLRGGGPSGPEANWGEAPKFCPRNGYSL